MNEENGGKGISGEVIRRLTDQTKTLFTAALLVLWGGTLKSGANAPVNRGPLLVWVIGSVLFFLFLVLVRGKVRQPKLRWVLPFVGFALLWLMYWIFGLPLQSRVYSWSTEIGVGLLVWSVLLLASLIIVMKRSFRVGRLGRAIRWFVKWGGDISLQVSGLVFMVGVISGLARLLNAGMTGWWMMPLIVLGMVIMLVVVVAPSFYPDDRV